MSILVVDDAEEMGLLICSFLKSAGYDDLLVAKSAHEALQLLGIDKEGKKKSQKNGAPRKTKEDNVELILMDVVMPGMNGFEACRRIHSSEKYYDTPVIMVTGRQAPDNLETAFYAGALYYVKKPLNRVELLARVRSTMRLKMEIDRLKEKDRELKEARREIKMLRHWILEECGIEGAELDAALSEQSGP